MFMNKKLMKAFSVVIISATLLASVDGTAAASEWVADVGAAERPVGNSQLRHTVCTGLSEAARAYYSGEYAYSRLSQLSGATAIASGEAAMRHNELYDALHKLMTETHTFYPTYSGYKKGSLAYYWQSTDAISEKDTYVMFYSDVPADTNGVKLNREHIWPKSRASFATSGGGADLHHLRPSVDKLNADKSDHAFGYINETYSANVQEGAVNGQLCYWVSQQNDLFECKDDVKGDVARILLYVYCRWQQPNLYSDVSAEQLPALDADDNRDSGLKVIESLDTLLQWCAEDPVDTWEMTRNDLVQQVQGNRNVFIDYPALAWKMFGKNPPKGMATPTQQGCAHQYAVVSQTPATCEADGQIIRQCAVCGNELHRRLAHNSHTDADADGFCDVCAQDLMFSVDVSQANLPHDGDYLILYNPSVHSTLSKAELTNGKIKSAPVTETQNGLRCSLDSAVFRVKQTDSNSFYLITESGFLTTSETGGSLFFSQTPSIFGEWRVEPSDVSGQVNIKNVGARYQSIEQYLNYYNGNYTTFRKSNTSGYQFELCVVANRSGDVNGDGVTDIDDATLVQKYVAMLLKSDDIVVTAADMNFDGRVDIYDATLIQMQVANL